jgi:hypothetical protein
MYLVLWGIAKLVPYQGPNLVTITNHKMGPLDLWAGQNFSYTFKGTVSRTVLRIRDAGTFLQVSAFASHWLKDCANLEVKSESPT